MLDKRREECEQAGGRMNGAAGSGAAGRGDLWWEAQWKEECVGVQR